MLMMKLRTCDQSPSLPVGIVSTTNVTSATKFGQSNEGNAGGVKIVVINNYSIFNTHNQHVHVTYKTQDNMHI